MQKNKPVIIKRKENVVIFFKNEASKDDILKLPIIKATTNSLKALGLKL